MQAAKYYGSGLAAKRALNTFELIATADSEPVLMQSPRYSYVELDVHKSRFRRRRRSRRRRCRAAAVAERVRHVMT